MNLKEGQDTRAPKFGRSSRKNGNSILSELWVEFCLCARIFQIFRALNTFVQEVVSFWVSWSGCVLEEGVEGGWKANYTRISKFRDGNVNLWKFRRGWTLLLASSTISPERNFLSEHKKSAQKVWNFVAINLKIVGAISGCPLTPPTLFQMDISSNYRLAQIWRFGWEVVRFWGFIYLRTFCFAVGGVEFLCVMNLAGWGIFLFAARSSLLEIIGPFSGMINLPGE